MNHANRFSKNCFIKYNLSAMETQGGETITEELDWQAFDPLDKSYTVLAYRLEGTGPTITGTSE